MVTIKLNKGKAVLMGLFLIIFSALTSAFTSAVPAHAAAGDVNVVAGMGLASNYTNLPADDTFTICQVTAAYLGNPKSLYPDCLANKPGTALKPPITSSLTTLKDKEGPNGGDEKAWTAQFTNVPAGDYVVCSKDFNTCAFFTKTADAANIRIVPDDPNAKIPGTAPAGGPGKAAGDSGVCTTGDGLAGALAWVLCPAVQLIASATTFFENNIILPFMTISPFTTNNENPVYILWQNIRNFANIGFILFFFVVIFSQATSIGISNYGIKRILPKMVVVVLGVNLSYFLVAFVVDAFNIFGAGISQLVLAALSQPGAQPTGGASAGTAHSIFVFGGAALLAIVATGGAAIGWFFSFLGLAMLVIVVVVIVLVLRQIAIIMLVIVSPVAILMYMLPNTENYFQKWRKTLIQLLMMYPMIVLLFASGKIFGVVLQQPDFQLAGDGVTPSVAQAIRVILLFIVYVVPFVFLPATFAASGAIMGRVYGALSKRAIQPRAQRLKEDAGQLGREAQLRLARNKAARAVGIGQLAGMGMRRNYIRDSRRRNLEREQQDYVAGAVGGSGWLRRRAAGAAGSAGRTRAAAFAANTAAQGRKEDIDNETALLESRLRDMGLSTKDSTKAISDFLSGKSGGVITSSDGKKTLNLNAEKGNLMRGMLNVAASQGEVGAIEAARMSSQVNQTDLDEIIRRNEGKLKEKGGYHLATNFKLAAGRDLDANNRAASQLTMRAERVLAMAQTGANNIAGMKAGVLQDTAQTLSDPGQAAAVKAEMDRIHMQRTGQDASALRGRLNTTMNQIISNPNVMARTDASQSELEDIRDGIL